MALSHHEVTFNSFYVPARCIRSVAKERSAHCEGPWHPGILAWLGAEQFCDSNWRDPQGFPETAVPTLHTAYGSTIKVDPNSCQHHKGRTERRLGRLSGGRNLELSDDRRDTGWKR